MKGLILKGYIICRCGKIKAEGEVENEEQNMEVQAPVLQRCLRLTAGAFQSCRCLQIWKKWACIFGEEYACP